MKKSVSEFFLRLNGFVYRERFSQAVLLCTANTF